mgnify:CR=1 FL=1
MRKSILLVISSVFCCISAIAEMPVEVQRVEGELRVGLTAPLGGFHGGSATVGPAFGAEIRYNIPKSSWDMGFQINATAYSGDIHPGIPAITTQFFKHGRSLCA